MQEVYFIWMSFTHVWKFPWNISNSYQVIEHTWFCDGQTDGSKGKNNMSPDPSRGVGDKNMPPQLFQRRRHKKILNIRSMILFWCMWDLGDNCIQNFHLWRYFDWYTVGNLFLLRCMNRAVKHDFRTNLRWYTSQNENFKSVYPHSNALLHFVSNLNLASGIKQNVIQRNVTNLITSNYFRKYITI